MTSVTKPLATRQLIISTTIFLGLLAAVLLIKAALPGRASLAFGPAAAFSPAQLPNRGQGDCVTPPPNLVSWWTFNETSGTVANDIRDKVNNVGFYGPGSASPSPTPGVVKGALSFDGLDDYVEVGLPADPEINFLGNCITAGTGESFTIDLWVKTPPTLGIPVILDKRVNGNPIRGYSLFLFGGKVGFQMNGVNFIATNGPVVADDQWHFLAVTVTRCKDVPLQQTQVCFYIDGGFAQCLPLYPGNVNALADLDNGGKLWIGRRDPSFPLVIPTFFRGTLDELEFFKRALSEAELDAIFNAGPAGKCKTTSCATPSFNLLPPLSAHAYPRFIVPVDWDGDYKLDLAVSNFASGDVSVLTAPSFAPPKHYPVGVSISHLGALAVSSFNSITDSRPDVAVINSSGGGPNDAVKVLTSPLYTVSDTISLSGKAPWGLAVGQFNTVGVGKDNYADFAVTNFTAGEVCSFKGDGKGKFLQVDVDAVPQAAAVAVGRFNNDLLDDLAVTTGSVNGMVTILNGNGDGTFNVGQSISVGKQPYSLVVADFNNDNLQDLAVTNYASAGEVSVLLNNSSGSFDPAVNYPVGPDPTSVAVGDFNCDDKLDLVTDNWSSTVSILLGKGDGGFGPKTDIIMGNTPTGVTVGDFNGDGRLDIATANYLSNDISILLNTCDCGCKLPEIKVQPVSQKICINGTATFNAVAVGNLPMTVQWQEYVNGVWTDITPNGTSNTHTTGETGKLFRAVFSNACGTATTNAVSVSYASPTCVLVGGGSGGDGASLQFPSQGGTGYLTMRAPGDARWTAVSDRDWIVFTSEPAGVSDGKVDFRVAPNPLGKERTGTIFAGGGRINITQAGASSPGTSGTSIGFADQPAARRVRDAKGNVLPANFKGATIRLARPATSVPPQIQIR